MTAEREFYDGEVVPGTRYRVIGLLGAGGMGSVYEVEHSELGKRFVLKALLRGLTNRDDLVRRLRNEWRALGQLEHPNIVSVTDAGVTTSGVPYFVMERLMGETLSARLRRERRLRVHDALGIAADVLEGLSAAHSLGIVHRDVKPPNVFLVKNRPAKLLDFGIAKMLDPKASQITGRGIAIGTPRYMSPEQTSGGKVDARSDLYSTGIILFEMITGAGPFDHARDGNELFLAQLTLPAPPVSRFVPVPPELDALLLRLLAKKADDRPASAALVAAEFRTLARALKHEPAPVSTPPPDDVTLPGGPFDTLEGAATVPSDGAVAPAESRPSRTLVGLAAPSARLPIPSETGGPTLRLDIIEPPDGATTHTALPRPEPIVQTPPPAPPAAQSVVSMPVAPRPRRRAAVIAAAIGACGLVAAGVVIAARRAPSEVSSPALARDESPAAVAVPAATPPPAELPSTTAPPFAPAASAAGPAGATEGATGPDRALPAPVPAELGTPAAPLPAPPQRPPTPKRPAKAVSSARAVATPARGSTPERKVSDEPVLPSSGL